MNIYGSKTMQEADSETAYLMLKIATERFQCAHSDLEKEQQDEVLNQAHKMQQLNHTILASSQADCIQVRDEDADKTLQEIIGRYETVEDFELAIKSYGLSVQNFRELIVSELRVNAVLDKVSESASVTKGEIADYYNNHQKSFFQPEMRKVRHILITVNDELDGNSNLDAQLRLNLMSKEIGNSQTEFEHFAMKKSECPSALHGGLIGTVPRGKLFPALDEELFSMTAHSLSVPIETEMGFHLVWCETIYPERLIPLYEVELEIRTHLQDRKRTVFQRQWIGQEIQKNKVSRGADH